MSLINSRWCSISFLLRKIHEIGRDPLVVVPPGIAFVILFYSILLKVVSSVGALLVAKSYDKSLCPPSANYSREAWQLKSTPHYCTLVLFTWCSCGPDLKNRDILRWKVEIFLDFFIIFCTYKVCCVRIDHHSATWVLVHFGDHMLLLDLGR